MKKSLTSTTLVVILIVILGVFLLYHYPVVPNNILENGNFSFVHSYSNLTQTGALYNRRKTPEAQHNRTEDIIVDKSDALTNCSIKQPVLSNTSLPVTALVSFPASGNTWTRHLIQQLTGLATASVDCDGALRKQQFPFECHTIRNQTIAVKTHYEQLHGFDRAILLIRNPFDAFYSFFNYNKAGHVGFANVTLLKEAGVFEEHVVKNMKRWVNLYTAWSKEFKGPVYVLQYEKLKTQLAIELKGLAVFLHANITTRDILCTVELQEGKFHRKNTKNQTERLALFKSLYNQTMVNDIKSKIKSVQELLHKNINKTNSIDLLQGNTMLK